jgi:hypothetical protein
MIPKGTRQLRRLLRVNAMLVFVALNGWLPAEIRAQEIEKDESPVAQRSLVVPEGTILPVRLNKALSYKRNATGDQIIGRVMQDVPLPNQQKIKAGAKVLGEIFAVKAPSPAGGGQISLRFDALEVGHQHIPIRANLRALAAWIEVYDADLPETPRDYGTSINWTTTYQVGGDVVYGFGGPVVNAAGEP